jgi:predicted metalloprotease
MRWESGRRSRNVEDQRGRRGPMPAKAGLGGLLLVGLLMYASGKSPSEIIGMLISQGGGQIAAGGAPSAEYVPTAEEQQLADMVSVVLADTEDVWGRLFAQMGKRYEEPKLVLFSGAVESACGHAQAAMGPFYCPADHKAYIDLSFYNDLKQRHNAPGDFAQAYVIAHEIGHHVQNLLGISDQVHRLRASGASETEVNQASVRLELQADFFAGVWAHHANKARQILEQGDVEEALTAATAIGDDRLQKEGRGYVVPDSFTHGTSAQRVRWFKKGLETGDFNQGNTFKIPYERL